MAMSEAALAAGRSAAARMMQDTAQVSRRSGVTKDPTTGLKQPAYTPVYETPCKVSAATGRDMAVRTVEVGGVERAVIEGGLHIPIPDEGSEAVQVHNGDRFTITAVGPMSDPGLLGRVFEVVEYGGKSWATARRLNVVEV